MGWRPARLGHRFSIDRPNRYQCRLIATKTHAEPEYPILSRARLAASPKGDDLLYHAYRSRLLRVWCRHAYFGQSPANQWRGLHPERSLDLVPNGRKPFLRRL